MKNKKVLTAVATMVTVLATMMASTATIWIFHQPKTPDTLA